MSPFEFDTLILPSLFIFFITLSVTFLFTKWPALSILVALKSGIFIGYFGFLFDGTFTFSDDWTYLKGGKYLNSKDIGFSNLDENWQSALNLAGGNHFIYYFQNALIMILWQRLLRTCSNKYSTNSFYRFFRCKVSNYSLWNE